jgi:hypothetical protein
MGGELAADDTPGRGITMIITPPTAAQPPPAGWEAADPAVVDQVAAWRDSRGESGSRR